MAHVRVDLISFREIFYAVNAITFSYQGCYCYDGQNVVDCCNFFKYEVSCALKKNE